jgi:hypothetical protein
MISLMIGAQSAYAETTARDSQGRVCDFGPHDDECPNVLSHNLVV